MAPQGPAAAAAAAGSLPGHKPNGLLGKPAEEEKPGGLMGLLHAYADDDDEAAGSPEGGASGSGPPAAGPPRAGEPPLSPAAGGKRPADLSASADHGKRPRPGEEGAPSPAGTAGIYWQHA